MLRISLPPPSELLSQASHGIGQLIGKLVGKLIGCISLPPPSEFLSLKTHPGMPDTSSATQVMPG